eukprot:6213199-Pleurochrysis_carterae.AAC.1
MKFTVCTKKIKIIEIHSCLPACRSISLIPVGRFRRASFICYYFPCAGAGDEMAPSSSIITTGRTLPKGGQGVEPYLS